MSFAIRPLIKRTSGKCQLCQSQVELLYLDSILGGRVCQDCEPFLGVAETVLLAAEFCHPPELDGVYLYDLDWLQGMVERTLAVRKQESAKCHQLIEHHVEDFQLWIERGQLLNFPSIIVELRPFGLIN